jgi:hypothetical protein
VSRILAVALLTVVMPSTGFAQEGFGMMGMHGPAWPHQEWRVQVETTGGTSVAGTLTLVSVPVECELGLYHILPERIKVVRFRKPGEGPAEPDERIPVPRGGPGVASPLRPGYHAGAVSTDKGGEIVGRVYVANWTLKTELGEVTLDPSGLKSVTFTGKVEPPHEAK